MKEKTFEELITEKRRSSINTTLYDNDIKELLQQVREATGNEFIKALEGVNLPTVATMKIMAIITTTDRIKLTENK